jgi:hypothetical protein
MKAAEPGLSGAAKAETPAPLFEPFGNRRPAMNKILNALNEPKVLAAVLTALYAITIALAFAIAAPPSAAAGELTYKPMEAIHETFGETQVAAVYVKDGRSCNVQISVRETGAAVGTDQSAAPSAAHLRLALQPGEAAMVDTADGQGISFSCGAGGDTLAVYSTAVRVADVW